MREAVSAQDLSAAFRIIKGEMLHLANVDATLTAAAWSGAGPYTQVLAVSGVSPSKLIIVGLSESATEAQRKACQEAGLYPSASGENTLTISASTKPSSDLPISISILG